MPEVTGAASAYRGAHTQPSEPHQPQRGGILGTMVNFLAFIYAEFKALCRSFYREAKTVIGTIGRRGWRPLIPWTLIAMGMAIAYRIAFGLPLPDVAPLLAAVAPFVLPTLMGQITRSKETLEGVANSGGLVNNAALS